MTSARTVRRLSLLAVPLLMMAAAPAYAQSLYEIDIETVENGGAPDSSLSYMCLSKDDLNQPVEKLTGPQCPAQTFERSGDVLTWTAQCDAASGEGQITFSRGGKAFEGESTITVNGQTVETRIEAKASGSCA